MCVCVDLENVRGWLWLHVVDVVQLYNHIMPPHPFFFSPQHSCSPFLVAIHSDGPLSLHMYPSPIALTTTRIKLSRFLLNHHFFKIPMWSKVIATVTFQSLFRRFPNLCGMSGTALSDAQEFGNVYGLRVSEELLV